MAMFWVIIGGGEWWWILLSVVGDVDIFGWRWVVVAGDKWC